MMAIKLKKRLLIISKFMDIHLIFNMLFFDLYVNLELNENYFLNIK
jgi:hypothetical protein